MKINVSRDSLASVLGNVTSIVPSNSTLPIMSHIRLTWDAAQGAMTLTGAGQAGAGNASSAAQQITASIAVDASESGDTTVPAKKFYDLVRSLPTGSDIALSWDAGQPRMTMTSGRSRMSLSTLPSTEHPTIEPSSQEMALTASAGEMRDYFNVVRHAMAKNDVRFFLNSVLVEVKDRITFVATDGHRLAVQSFDATVEGEGDALIPESTVGILDRILSAVPYEQDVTLRFSDNHVMLATDDYQLVSGLVDGKFPDWRRVVPTGSMTLNARFNAGEMRSAVHRVGLIGEDKKRHGVRLKFDVNAVTLDAEASAAEAQHEGHDEVGIESFDGEAVEIGLNCQYMESALKVIAGSGEEVSISVKDANSAAVLRPQGNSDRQIVIMPMRI